MLKIIKKDSNSKLLVVTPLLSGGHKINRETKIGIKRNDVPFTWISYESANNTAKNFQLGIDNYRKIYKIPDYVIMIDRDINPNRHMLDNMYNYIENSDDHIGYVYANFIFTGTINAQFVNIKFDPFKLMRSNFISSNSMIKTKVLDEIGGVVTDNKYKRLLDWCLWLKMLKFGYHGKLCDKAFFEVKSDPDSVSAGGRVDYQIKYKLVLEDFVKPLIT